MHFVNNVLPSSWDHHHHHSLLLLHAAATGGLPLQHLQQLQQHQPQVSPKKPQPFPATEYHHQVVVVEAAAGQQQPSEEAETKRRRRIQQQQQSSIPPSTPHHQLCYPSTNGVLRIPQQVYRPTTSTSYHRDPNVDDQGDSENGMRTTKLLPSSTKGQHQRAIMPLPLPVCSGPADLLPAPSSTTRTTAPQHQEEKADVLLTTTSTHVNSTPPTLSPEAQEVVENAQKNLASLLGAYEEALRTYDERHNNNNTKKSTSISRTSKNNNKRPRSLPPVRSNTAGVVPTTGRVLLLEGVIVPHHEQRHDVTNGNHEVGESSGSEANKMARPSRGPPKKRRMVA
uniref:Uncharacterized protein n=1 Tax=Grammatophora oceanica TaxID=210454 RepID=A0A7S1YNJ7_9STRA